MRICRKLGCRREATGGYSYCERCRMYWRLRQWRQRRVSELRGECIDHGCRKPAQSGRLRCEHHLRVQRIKKRVSAIADQHEGE